MTTAVRLREDLEKRLSSLAKKTHRSKSFYIQRAIEEFLEEQEDYLLAISRLETYDKDGKKGISLEEIEEKIKLRSE
jgi:RHH-type transcriptional regulator, rel operon repressor / antitoxin RelB